MLDPATAERKIFRTPPGREGASGCPADALPAAASRRPSRSGYSCATSTGVLANVSFFTFAFLVAPAGNSMQQLAELAETL